MSDSKLSVVLHRDGEHSPVTISHDKCLIRTVQGDQKTDCCAIFNGPYGTALRSYTENVLVNGEPTSARWLVVGDQIQLPCLSRIEVKAATKLRPSLPAPRRTAAEIDQQLAAISRAVDSTVQSADIAEVEERLLAPMVPDPVMPTVEVLDNVSVDSEPATVAADVCEETFHSPFSEDLPAMEPIATTSEAMPIATDQTAAPVEATTQSEVDVEQVEAEVAAESEAETKAGELESIFARMGVTSVGNITPHSEDDAPTEEGADTESVAAAVSSLASPEPETPTAADATESLRQKLESVFANDSEPSVPQATEQVSVLPVPETTPDPVEASVLPSSLDSIVEDSTPDPLAELPADLRNQLNDLVSSLESEVPTEVDVDVDVPVVSELDQVSVQVPTPAVETPAAEQFSSEAETEAETEVTAEEDTPPMRDESISHMFEEVMRAIQGEPHSTETESADRVEAVGPVEAVEPVGVVEEAVEPRMESRIEPQVEPPIEPTPVFAASETPFETPAETLADTPVEVPVEQEPTVSEPEPQSRSVSDILSAMGMEVPGQEEANANANAESNSAKASTPAPFSTPTPEPTPTPAPEPTPEPIEPQVQSVPASPVFANMQNAPAGQGQNGTESVGNAEDDIQAYMNRLLNRPTAMVEPVPPTPEEVQEAEAVALQVSKSKEMLSAEEFVPSHKPSRPENYDTLREIANTCSRTAIHQSCRKAQKENAMLKIIAGLVSLILAGVAFFFGLAVPAGILVAVAAICFVLCFLKSAPGKKAVVKTTTRKA